MLFAAVHESAYGPKQTSASALQTSAFGGKADIGTKCGRAGQCPEKSSIEILGVSSAVANYRSEITSPLRSAATISPAWRPASLRTAPFWLASTIAPAPGPTATPAPAAP
jgi:hypothetical protein